MKRDLSARLNWRINVATKSLQRTKKRLKEMGISSWKAEASYNTFSGKKVDLFNIIDLVALYVDEGICGIQCCGTDFAEHDRKILASPYSREWLESHGILELWSWRKLLKKKGGKLKIWEPKIKRYTLDDFNINQNGE